MRIVSLSQNGSEFEWARRAEDKIARDEPDASWLRTRPRY